MNAPKCTAADDIDCLVASPRAVSGTEAARVRPAGADRPAHAAFTRLLHRLEPDPATLWAEAAPLVARERGILVLDDSTLDKPYARRIELVTRHWSGKHKRVVHGSNLLTVLWTDGDRLIPVDDRLYDKAHDGLTKNDHFRALPAAARPRGFRPACVAFDSWYASLDNLKAVREAGWRWLTQLKGNRLVTPDGASRRPLAACAIAATGTRVQLQGDGFVRVCRLVAPDGDTEYWATSDLDLDELRRVQYAEWAWGIEEDHRVASSTAGWSGRRCGPREPSAPTSAAPSGPSCASNGTARRPASGGGRPSPASCARRCAPTWPPPATPSPDPQPRNS
jgi:putative transposase